MGPQFGVNAGGSDHPLVEIGVAQDIEPAPSIADAVLFAGEKAIDYFLVGLGRRLFEEGFLFGRCGRNADEVEINASQ